MKNVYIIDNYDSFTYNIVHLLEKNNHNVIVLKNDCNINDITCSKCDKIIISPGPGSPRNSGICFDVLKKFTGRVDILGVCLGHQIIVEYFGGKVVCANTPMHGKISQIEHKDNDLFKNIANPFNVARYHSLIADKSSIPACLNVIATNTKDNDIMAISHIKYNIFGIQFHPESFLTQYGEMLLNNFVNL